MTKIRVKSDDSNIEIAYRDQGRGRAIIFLHAFPLNQRMWDEQAAYFSNKYRTVTFDWRGFGESDRAKEKSPMETLADDLAGLMDALAIERSVLCGLSMGGYTAFAFHRKYADRITALILADTKASADVEEGKRGRYEMAELALKSGAAAIADYMITKLLAPVTLKNKTQVVERVRAMIEGNLPEGIAAAQRGMAERADSVELLARISCPTLVIAGSDDSLTPPDEAERMCGQIPNAGFALINEAGHLSNLEQPEEFNRVVADFLNQL